MIASITLQSTPNKQLPQFLSIGNTTRSPDSQNNIELILSKTTTLNSQL